MKVNRKNCEKNIKHLENQKKIFVSRKSGLTLCALGGGPKDPQLSKSLNALKWVHKNGWNVFDFSYIDLKKISNQKF